MMDILTDKFPTAIKINNAIYKVNADFRNCLPIIKAFEDPELTMPERCEILLQRLFIDPPPATMEAIEQGIKFLDCGRTRGEPKEVRRVFSFIKDSAYIFSGMKQTHGIDLEEVGFLHWWKFLALFYNLPSGNLFTDYYKHYRAIDTSKMPTDNKEQRAEKARVESIKKSVQIRKGGEKKVYVPAWVRKAREVNEERARKDGRRI